MFLQKNKALFSMTIVTILLLIFGVFFMASVFKTEVGERTDFLKNTTAQGASAIHAEILDHLDVLRVLSSNAAFSQKANAGDRISALSQKEVKRCFSVVAYCDPSGVGVTDTGSRLAVGDKPYFQKALQGICNISDRQISRTETEILLAVPVIHNGVVTGALIAALDDIGQLFQESSVGFGKTEYRCILKEDGTILFSNFSVGMANFFDLIQPADGFEQLNKIKEDFISGASKTQKLQMKETTMVVSYSGIEGTDSWIFLAADDYKSIFAKANRVLLPSIFLFLILIFGFFLAFFYFFKLKKLKYETKIRNEEQKKYFTFFDPLTNLPNRKGIIRQFDVWIDRYRKESSSGGAVLLDVDNLRSINNTFGHDAGDKLLRESVERLKKVVGSQNLFGRIGSDEFIILVHGVSSESELAFFARKITKIFRQSYLINGLVVQISCSIGALLFSYRDENRKPRKFEDILGRGEFVLNKAKQTRKGNYILFNETYGNQIDRQIRLERALKFSIENEELPCYFQPQYNSFTKSITGFETLARWKSTEFGMISPGQFIPMAEKSGFIKEIGRHVIESAFSFAKSMEGRHLTVSFNASPMELLEANYADYVISRFQYYGLQPNSVAIEVTESCLIESFEKVTQKLMMLKRHGILVYLDDFGTGFSSLTYLKNLPINAVKIDKSFIDEIVTKDVEKDIVRMIIKLAGRLNLQVIAEGVETEDQIRCVSDAGCHLIQGYFISRPVPQEEVPTVFSGVQKSRTSELVRENGPESTG